MAEWPASLTLGIRNPMGRRFETAVRKFDLIQRWARWTGSVLQQMGGKQYLEKVPKQIKHVPIYLILMLCPSICRDRDVYGSDFWTGIYPLWPAIFRQGSIGRRFIGRDLPSLDGDFRTGIYSPWVAIFGQRSTRSGQRFLDRDLPSLGGDFWTGIYRPWATIFGQRSVVWTAIFREGSTGSWLRFLDGDLPALGGDFWPPSQYRIAKDILLISEIRRPIVLTTKPQLVP